MLSRNITTLMHAVRGRVVLKYYGLLCLTLVGLTGVPLLVALVLWEPGFAWRFALVTALLVAVGWPLGRLPPAAQLQLNEALATTALTFLTAGLVMSFALAGAGLAAVDALFEGFSAITTTGLSALASVEGRSPVFLFARAWGQWYGGLVIVVLALALVLQPGTIAKRLADVDSGEDLLGGTRGRARRVLVVYVTLTACGLGLVWAVGPGFFEALLHVLTGVSTGGFSSHDASLASLTGGWPAQAVLLAVALTGAVSFPLYIRAWSTGWRALALDRELIALLVLIAVVAALLAWTLALAGRLDAVTIALHAPLTALSAQSGTGFSTVDVAAFDPASKLVLIGSMIVGGDLGSTAGGIKILRLLVILHLAHQIVVNTCLPRHAVVPPRVAGRHMDHEELTAALTTVLWYAIIVVVSWLPFLVLEVAPLDALFEVTSALATAGLSAGVAGPALHPLLKLVLVADMLLGRVEIIAVLVLLYPGTWLGRSERSP